MKKTLLILSLFVFSFSNGQTAITAFNGTLGADVNLSGDGQNTRENITRFAPGSTFSQNASGPNQVWDITGLTEITTSFRYSNTAPTPGELATYPGTTMVCTNFSNLDNAVVSKLYCSGTVTPSGLIGLGGLTGYSDNELTLNYTTNNVDLGTFPKVYGTTTSDVVAGTYIFGEYNGTFTGTYTTSVDAYGTMDGSVFEIPFPVTRFKTVENLEISYPGLGLVGTFVQTTYCYYRANEFWPYVKSTNRVLTIAALSIDTNVTQIEKAPSSFELSLPEIEANKSITLFPNPATNTITINTSQEITSLTVVDQLGKVVLTKNESATLDVSELQSGIYFIRIETEKGSVIKKFIKN